MKKFESKVAVTVEMIEFTLHRYRNSSWICRCYMHKSYNIQEVITTVFVHDLFTTVSTEEQCKSNIELVNKHVLQILKSSLQISKREHILSLYDMNLMMFVGKYVKTIFIRSCEQ